MWVFEFGPSNVITRDGRDLATFTQLSTPITALFETAGIWSTLVHIWVNAVPFFFFINNLWHVCVSSWSRPVTSARTTGGRARLPVEPAWPATGRAADKLSTSPGEYYSVCGEPPYVVQQYKYLGIWFDDELTFKTQGNLFLGIKLPLLTRKGIVEAVSFLCSGESNLWRGSLFHSQMFGCALPWHLFLEAVMEHTAHYWLRKLACLVFL